MKKIKSITALMLALAIIAIGAVVQVNAAGNPLFSFNTASGKAGEEVALTLSCSNNPGVNGWAVDISYDATALELTEVDKTSVFGTVTVSENISENPFRVQWFDLNNSTANGTIIELTFKIAENAKAGDYEVSISYEEDNVVNADEQNVHFDTANGVITVEASETDNDPATEPATVEPTESDDASWSGTRVYFDDYSLIVPDTWGYEVSDNKVGFYEKTICEETGYGSIMAISKWDEYHDYQVAGVKYLAEHNGYYYYTGGPTSPDTDTSDERLLNLWLDAAGLIDDVLATLEWNDTEASIQPTTSKSADSYITELETTKPETTEAPSKSNKATVDQSTNAIQTGSGSIVCVLLVIVVASAICFGIYFINRKRSNLLK